MAPERRTTREARPLIALPFLSIGVVACGPVPPPEPPPPEALEYRVPAIDQALYTVADTANVMVHAGRMGQMSVTTAFAGTVLVRVRPEGDGFEGEVRFLQFRGSFDSEPHATQYVDERDIGGSFTVRIDPRGRLHLADTPALTRELTDVAGAESLVRPIFVHLPGRPTGHGDRWIDTVTVVERGRETETRSRSIIITTLAGDTVVDGRPLPLLHTRLETKIDVTGRSGGVAVRQRLTGVTIGIVIWDDRLNLLVERREQGHLAGSLEMEGAPEGGVPVTAEVRRSVVLQR